jgi:hypothetical protein
VKKAEAMEVVVAAATEVVAVATEVAEVMMHKTGMDKESQRMIDLPLTSYLITPVDKPVLEEEEDLSLHLKREELHTKEKVQVVEVVSIQENPLLII